MFELPDLPYDYTALEPFVDEETLRVHHDGHHAAYVKKLNEALSGLGEFLDMDIEELLRSLNKVPEEVRTKVKNNGGGHYHHSLFWTFLAPNGRQPEGRLLQEINKEFGSLERFKEGFNSSASAVFGSGWTWLVWDSGKLAIVNSPNQDSPVSAGQTILMGIDLWEHAYYLKYKNKRDEFLAAWWNIANWKEAEKRFNAASG